MKLSFNKTYWDLLLFWDVAQHRLVITDILVQPVVPIFKGQALIFLGMLDPRFWDPQFVRSVGN